MRILFDCSNLKTGGALQNGLSFIKMAMHDNRHEWYIAVSYELSKQVPSEWEDKFAFFKRLSPLKNIIDYNNLRKKMLKIESTIKPDIVFSMFGPAYWRPTTVQVSGFAIPYFLYPDVDIFYTTKGFQRTKLLLKHFLLLKLKKYLFCKSDYLVAETDTVKKRAASHLGFPENRIFVAHNSFSPIFKDEMQKASNQKVSYASEENDIFRLLIPSAWYWHKNLEIIPEVSFHLKKLGFFDFKFRLTIPDNSAAWRNIFAKSVRNGTDKNLETAGMVPHKMLLNEYAKCNAIFLPTLMECSTAVYPEAMAAGRLIITSDLDFAHEVCGTAALYFNPLNPIEAAEKIYLAIKNPELCKSLIAQGYKQLKSKFPSPEQKYENQVKILEEIVKFS